MRTNCKTLVVREPIFHSKFCTKRHPHHKKVLCSWSTGGSGGASGAAQSSTAPTGHQHTIVAINGSTGHMTVFDSGGNIIGDITLSPSGPMQATGNMGHENDDHHGVPGPIVGGGIPGLVLLAVMALRWWRR